jgi:hypothetical protein
MDMIAKWREARMERSKSGERALAGVACGCKKSVVMTPFNYLAFFATEEEKSG